MTEQEMLTKIQEVADQTAQNFVFKRTAKLDLVYSEKQEDGSTDCYCLGADMPLLVYRVFNVKEDGTATEISDIQQAVEKTRHYDRDVKPALGLDKAPLITGETHEYEILLENKLENNGVEVKLKSSIGRDVTMMEIYRYFDYVSKIYFVTCVSLSFGGQYLFSVTPDSKHLRLIVGNDQTVRSRVDMITELLAHRLLPSYQTIAAGAQLLSGQTNSGVQFNIPNPEDQNNPYKFNLIFCYDDAETKSRYAFSANNELKRVQILVVDIFNNNKLSAPNEEQQKAAERIHQLWVESQKDEAKRNEFNAHVVPFFSDDLDFRFEAYKNGTLKANEPAPAAEAPKAE